MKLLIVIDSLALGGAERVAVNMANYYAQTGSHVCVMTFSSEPDFYSLNSSVVRLRLNESTRTGIVLRTFSRIRFIRHGIRTFEPDCSLGILTESSTLLALSRLGLKGRFIGSEHSYPPFFNMGLLREFARKISYRWLDVVTGLTNDSSLWISQNTYAKNVVTIPNAINWPLPEFQPKLCPDKYLPNNYKLLLGVGRLSYEKGMIYLIEAFAKISNQNPEWVCLIIGEGPERPMLENRIKELGQEGRIFLPGKAGNVEDWYRRASLFAMTSRVEGFGNTLVEAMGTGLASISFDADAGPRDIITDKYDGELIEPGNTEMLASRLNFLMKNCELRDHYALNAMNVRDRYSNQVVYSKWNAVFTPPR